MKKKGYPNYARLNIDEPARYRIRIKGELEKRFADRMEGMQISKLTEENGSIVSTLEGEVIDQAALFGVLVALYNMRLPLISVECTDNENDDADTLIKVRIEQKTDHLEFIITGAQSNLPIPEPLETILNSCELAGLYRVLVDFRGLVGGYKENPEIEYVQGVGQEYQDYLARGGVPIKAAVVGPKEMIKAWKQSEKIVLGFGLKAFISSDFEEAVAWLRSNKKGQ